MVTIEILRLIIHECLDNPDVLEALREDKKLVRLFNKLGNAVNAEVGEEYQTIFAIGLSIPNQLLSALNLKLYYQNWGLSQRIVDGLAEENIQPRALIDMSLDTLSLHGVGGTGLKELKKTIKMMKIILGIEMYRGGNIPSSEYYAHLDLQSVTEYQVKRRTNEYLESIGYPWVESLTTVAIVMKTEYKPEYMLANLTEYEIRKRKTWNNIQARVRLLKLYLEAIKKTAS